MRIAFLSTEFVTESVFDGGLANYLDRVSTALAAREHEPEIFVISDRTESFWHGRTLVHRLAVPARGVTRLPIGPRRKLADLPLDMTKHALETSHALYRALRKRHAVAPFDIVQASQHCATGLFAAGGRLDVPVVTRLSSYAPWWRRAAGWRETIDLHLANRMESVAARLSAGCYAPSRMLADAVQDLEGIEVDVIEPPFVAPAEPDDPAKADELRDFGPYLLFFGQMTRVKGAKTLCAALPVLFGEIPDLRVVLAGGRPDHEGHRLIGMADEHPDRVRYLGVVRAPALRPIVQQARVVALPSLLENLPNTCLESMAAGRVVIGTAGASFEQLIDDGRSGFLVPAGDTPALRAAIARAWRMDEAERMKMGEAAQEQIARLSPDITVPSLEAFYRGAIARHARSPACLNAGDHRSRFRVACLSDALIQAVNSSLDQEDELVAARSQLEKMSQMLRERETELESAHDTIRRIERGKIMRIMNALQRR